MIKIEYLDLYSGHGVISIDTQPYYVAKIKDQLTNWVLPNAILNPLQVELAEN
jgi:acetylornithine/succinyldiaminopimelate/putrescine aminotransferase